MNENDQIETIGFSHPVAGLEDVPLSALRDRVDAMLGSMKAGLPINEDNIPMMGELMDKSLETLITADVATEKLFEAYLVLLTIAATLKRCKVTGEII